MVKRLYRILPLVAILANLLAVTPGFSESSLPWRRGDCIGGWLIEVVERHPEFIRYTLRRGDRKTAVEIVFNEAGPDRWATARHRLQPAPGKRPAPLLLRRMVRFMKEWEARETTAYLVRPNLRPDLDMNDRQALTDATIFGNTVISAFEAIAMVILLFAFIPALEQVAIDLRRSRGEASRLANFLSSVSKGLKLALFWGVALLPPTVVSLLALSIVQRSIQISRLEAEDELAALNVLLESKKGHPLCIAEMDGRRGYIVDEEFIPFDHGPDEVVVYVFGGSSVVMPGRLESFPNLLEGLFNADGCNRFKIYNFGMAGFDSFSVLSHLRRSLDCHRPDAIIIYMGHNDYTNIYNSRALGPVLITRGNAVLVAALKSYYRFIYFPTHWLMDDAPPLAYVDMMRFFVNPLLHRHLQEVGVLKIDASYFDRLNGAILKQYKRNVNLMITAANSREIPLILITPVSNLMTEPYGIDRRAEDLFARGLAEQDYAARIDFLIRARDRDVFSGDIRAKSELNDFLRSLEGPGVLVFDLECGLIDDGFNFGFEGFNDYVHLTPEMHEHVAIRLHHFLLDRWICCGHAIPR